jgi:C1A family cysteine protease
MNYSLLALLALVAASSVEASHPREHYEQLFFEHMTKFQLDFKDGKEFLQRLEIFAKNFDFIESHNSNTKNTYKLGLNQFAHLTFDEFLDTVHINGASPPNLRRAPADFLHTAPSNLSELPAEVDHVAAGAVTAVKNQGSCGSCWAFSTVGAIESAYKLKHGDLKTFSEQEIVSCDIGGDDLGCNGGWMDSAFEWVKSNGGITTSDAYPYTSGTGGKTGTCKTTGYENDPKTAPQSYTDVQTGSVTALQSAVALQPVSIAIQANQLAFQFYQSGVLTGKCGQRLDHGVLLVGYGTDSSSGLDFWKIKNSWGSTWGEGGYIRILRSSDDLCGVLDAPSYPNL